jgi:hypothetical protein
MTRRVVAWLIAAALGVVAGCSDSPTSPTGDEDTDEAVTTPVTVTYVGLVGPNGSAARRFTAQLAGTASLAIHGITPAAALIVGLGIPRADGTGCLLSRSVTALDGAPVQVTAHVDPGEYCAQVLGPADAPGPVGYSVTLEHP